MKTTMELILEMSGCLILFIVVIWAFVRFTGYGKYYDKMVNGIDDTKSTIKKKRIQNGNIV
jgi:hypothetical protein